MFSFFFIIQYCLLLSLFRYKEVHKNIPLLYVITFQVFGDHDSPHLPAYVILRLYYHFLSRFCHLFTHNLVKKAAKFLSFLFLQSVYTMSVTFSRPSFLILYHSCLFLTVSISFLAVIIFLEISTLLTGSHNLSLAIVVKTTSLLLQGVGDHGSR